MIGQIISHYKILEKLGEGGMGVVYKAHDTKLNRTVALKFLPSQMGIEEDERKRFLFEAQAASTLDHSNICTIHSIEETEDGRVFIVMAYYEGVSLKERIEQGPLPLKDVINYGIQIASGLQKAHERGIVHRDLKPANIFITSEDQIKIIDFGLAKATERSLLTKSGMTLGTVPYMSPEQAQGAKVDHRTDIWSLGVLMYEMITGQRPFKSEYETALVYSILNEDPEPVTGLRTGVPMELERTINKCLAKDPSERYQHIQDMSVDLKATASTKESRQQPKQISPAPPRKISRYLYPAAGIFLVIILLLLYPRSESVTTVDSSSIAVLPFVNLNIDDEDDYFSDGLTDELINALAKITNLKVVSRTSSFQFKGRAIDVREIGTILNVSSVLEGSVRKSDDRLRITVQLVNVDDGYQLWSETFEERTLHDVFIIQEEIARTIAEKLRITISKETDVLLAERYTENLEAYDLYLQGRYQWNLRTRSGFENALKYFYHAVELDPAFALGYAGLADTYILLGTYGFHTMRESHPKARVYAEKALEINSNLAEAHTSLAAVLTNYYWNWQQADIHFQRAIELNPNNASAYQWYAQHLSYRKNFEPALSVAQRALEIDPLSVGVNHTYGVVLYHAQQYDDAIVYFQQLVDRIPWFGFSQLYLALSYLQMGMYDESITTFQTGRSRSNIPELVALHGYAMSMAGRHDEARSIFNEFVDLSGHGGISSVLFSTMYVALGETDAAFEWLEKAYEDREWQLGFLDVEPLFDPIRSDERFLELLQKIGLESAVS